MTKIEERKAEISWVSDAVIRRAREAAVVVNPHDGTAITGFFVSEDGLVVTTAAGLEGLKSVVLLTSGNGKLTTARVAALDPLSDVAVLFTGVKPPAWLTVASVPAPPGSPCAVVRQSGGEGALKAADGCLLALRDVPDWTGSRFLRVWSVALPPNANGITGAPAVTADGKVAGMCGFVSGEPPQRFVFAIPAEALRAVLARAHAARKPLPFPKDREISGAGVPGDRNYGEAMTSLSLGDIPAALRGFQLSLEKHPDNPLVLRQIAFCQAREGDPVAARATAERALAVDPGRLDVRELIGQILSNEEDVEGTVSHFTALTAEAPSYGDAWGMLATGLLRSGRKAEALAATRKWTELEPDALRAWLGHEEALYGNGDFDGARRAKARADALENLFYKLRFSAPARD